MAYSLDKRDGIDEISCEFCKNKYNSKELIPKVLNCGHVICLKCVLLVIENIRKCPICNETLKECNASNIPTYFGLLKQIPDPSGDLNGLQKWFPESDGDRLVGFLRRLPNSPQDPNCLLRWIPNSSDNIPSEFKTIEDLDPSEMKLKTMRCIFEIRTQRMKKMNKITYLMNEKLNECVQILNTCKDLREGGEQDNLMDEIEKILWRLNFISYSYYKPKPISDITRNSFQTDDDFLLQIMVQLNTKKVYAFKSEWFNNGISFGKLSYSHEKGILFIHTFTTEQPPFPSILVSLNDLKDCMNIFNFRTFLKMVNQIFICEMLTSSMMTLNFIRLCSGEDGTSMKFLNGRYINLPGLEDMIDLKIEMPKPKTLDDYTFIRSLPQHTVRNLEDKIRIRMYEGRCEFVKMPSPPSSDSGSCSGSSTGYEGEPLKEVVAVADSYGILFLCSYIKSIVLIQDCGICLKIPFTLQEKYISIIEKK